jgi:hypothetical protein
MLSKAIDHCTVTERYSTAKRLQQPRRPGDSDVMSSSADLFVSNMILLMENLRKMGKECPELGFTNNNNLFI